MSSYIQVLQGALLFLTGISITVYFSYTMSPRERDPNEFLWKSEISIHNSERTTNRNEISRQNGSENLSSIVSASYQTKPSHVSNRSNLNLNSVNDMGKSDSLMQRILLFTQGIWESPSPLTRFLYKGGYRIPAAHLCPNHGKDLKILILITSAVNNAHKRSAIRLTWGHYSLRSDVRIAFLVGLRNQTPSKNLIETESDLYKDIIQGNNEDVYDNLSLKSISMMEWIGKHCPQVRFVLKTDDDMFINVPELLHFISTHDEAQRVFYGRLAHSWHPFRDPGSKYYLSHATYPDDTFPDFTTGPAYLFTTDVVRAVYTRALATPYIKLEDVFITGIVAQTLNISRVNDAEFLNVHVSGDKLCSKIKKSISVHEVNFTDQFDLWKKLLNEDPECT